MEESGPVTIAVCYGANNTCEANARLIAAAPELLDACEQLMSALDCASGEADVEQYDERLDKAFALAKAAVGKAKRP